jgi:hypothetical protein
MKEPAKFTVPVRPLPSVFGTPTKNAPMNAAVLRNLVPQFRLMNAAVMIELIVRINANGMRINAAEFAVAMPTLRSPSVTTTPAVELLIRRHAMWHPARTKSAVTDVYNANQINKWQYCFFYLAWPR